MHRILFFILFFLFVFSIGYAQSLQTDTNTWDFGKIHASKGEVKHIFLLKNNSSELLNINGTHASCGCTVPAIDKKAILPKESANLEVRFNPKGYSGAVTQYVYVNTDSKSVPIYRFIVKAEVIKE